MAVAQDLASESESVSISGAGTHGLLEKIEDFCGRPDFTESIATFASQFAPEFASGPVEGEHPLRWHELYLQYTALIESQLEAFLKEEGVPVAALLAAASGEANGAYTCIDYLVASTEYDAFLQLMADFCAISAWDDEAGESSSAAVGGCLEDGTNRSGGGEELSAE